MLDFEFKFIWINFFIHRMKQVPIVDRHKVINESFRGMKMVSLHFIYPYNISHVPLFILVKKEVCPKWHRINSHGDTNHLTHDSVTCLEKFFDEMFDSEFQRIFRKRNGRFWFVLRPICFIVFGNGNVFTVTSIKNKINDF